METIEIFSNTSAGIEGEVEGIDSLSGFTGHLTIKKRPTSTAVMSKNSTDIEGLVVNFELDITDTAIARGMYLIEFAISKSSERYVISQDRVKVSKSLKWG